MKFIHILFFIAVLPFVFSACMPAEPEIDAPPPIPKEINAVEEDSASSGSGESSLSSSPDGGLEAGPLIELSPDFVPVKIFNQNLDLDQNDEQIIFGKPKDDPEGEIELKLIDYDTVSEKYFLAWEGKTQATNIRTFIISYLDIIGDHKKEIVCSGIDKDGLRSLDIFRQTFSPTGIGLYYTSICSIKADGSIDIHEYERSQAYKQGQRNGRSFPIITFSQDKNSENIMDLIREEYYWKYQENRYVKGRVESIPGRKIEAAQLRELFMQDTQAFEEFLSGPWFYGDLSDRETMRTIFFDPSEKNIIFYSNDIQEMYVWESSHRTRIPNSIYISVTNQMVPFIKKYISIYVESLDVITIEINDRDFTKSNYMWDGTFTRLHDSAKGNLLRTDKAKGEAAAVEVPRLSGEYRRTGGDTVSFNHPELTMVTGGEERRGKYSVYSTDDGFVLDVKVLSEAKTVIDSYQYLINQIVDETERLRIYRLTMIPGTIGISGFTPFDGNSELYIRYETIEDENESGEE